MILLNRVITEAFCDYVNTIKHSLPQMDPVVVVHNFIDISEAPVVEGAFDDDGEETNKHDADLEDIGPHDGLHAALSK